MAYGKTCTTCNVEKPLEMFSFRKHSKFGRNAKCRECLSIQFGDMRKAKHKEYIDKPKNLTQEQALHLFEYKNGNLFWKNTTHPKIKIGSQVGFINDNGYCVASIYGKKYLAHQIVYLMQHGYIPKAIDHINNIKVDNRIENLREVTRQQNMQNKPLSKTNTTGYKNVYWKEKNKKWEVAISVDGKRKYIGIYKDLELADLVATEARDKYYGEYANHGLGV